MQVTPEVATKWLEKNTHNRPIRQHLVDSYALAMKRGEWRLTPEPIAFSKPFTDANGNHCKETLIEGQHRLWAVVEAGVAAEMTVWFGCEPEEFEVIGQGAERTLGDMLSTTRSDLPHPTLMASVLSALYRHGIGGSATFEPWMAKKILTHIEADVVIAAHYKNQLRKLCPRPMAGALMLAQMVNPAQAGVLVKQIKDAIGFTERDPARALHLYLHAMNAENTRDTTDVAFYKIANAVAAKLSGKPLMILRVNAEGLIWLRDAARPKLTAILNDIFGKVPEGFWTPRLLKLQAEADGNEAEANAAR
jgi:hypothetical protein